MEDVNVSFAEVHYVTIQKVGNVPVIKGDFQSIPRQIQSWLAQMVCSDTLQIPMFACDFLDTIVHTSCCVHL